MVESEAPMDKARAEQDGSRAQEEEEQREEEVQGAAETSVADAASAGSLKVVEEGAPASIEEDETGDDVEQEAPDLDSRKEDATEPPASRKSSSRRSTRDEATGLQVAPDDATKETPTVESQLDDTTRDEDEIHVAAPETQQLEDVAIEAAKVGFCAGHWKKLLTALVLITIIALVVLDTISLSCTSVEKEKDRQQRLFCAGFLNATEDDFQVLPDQVFSCNSSTAEGEVEEWMAAEDGSETCVAASACLSNVFNDLLDFIAENPGVGWLVTAAIYAVLTVLLIPGSVLTIGSGLAFGTALGLGQGTLVGGSAVIVGAISGLLIAFLVGRFLLRELVEAWILKYPVMKAIDKTLDVKGFQLVLLLRLSPLVPYNVFNFIMGATSCSFRDYAIGSAIGILPGTFAFVFIGALVGSAAFGDGTAGQVGFVMPELCEPDPQEAVIRQVVLIAGIVATIIAVGLITVYARRQFRAIQEEQAAQDAA